MTIQKVLFLGTIVLINAPMAQASKGRRQSSTTRREHQLKQGQGRRDKATRNSLARWTSRQRQTQHYGEPLASATSPRRISPAAISAVRKYLEICLREKGKPYIFIHSILLGCSG